MGAHAGPEGSNVRSVASPQQLHMSFHEDIALVNALTCNGIVALQITLPLSVSPLSVIFFVIVFFHCILQEL